MRLSVIAFVLGTGTMATVFGCSNSSSSDADAGSGSGSGSGAPVSTCNTPSTQTCVALTFSDQFAAMEVAQTNTDCTKSGGTVVSSCPTDGLVGCCTVSVSDECFYSGTESDQRSACVAGSGGTWATGPGGASSDGGAVASGGASAFVGVWGGMLNTVETCGTSAPTNLSQSSTATITLGSAADSLDVATANGCMWSYQVSGNVATGIAGQVCDVKGSDGGVTEVLTVQSRTFTLTSAGSQLSESGNIMKMSSTETCSDVETATLTPQ